MSFSCHDNCNFVSMTTKFKNNPQTTSSPSIATTPTCSLITQSANAKPPEIGIIYFAWNLEPFNVGSVNLVVFYKKSLPWLLGVVKEEGSSRGRL